MRNTIQILALLVFFFVQSTFAQRVVNGTVITADSYEVIPGATVAVKNLVSIGTVCDIQGRFSLTVPDSATMLVVSFVGMITQEVKITDEKNLTVKLENEALAMEEVVVTSLGVKRESKSLGYASESSESMKVRGMKSVASESSDFFCIGIATDDVKVDARSVGVTTSNTNYRSHLLTAGEIHDFSKWTLWQDIEKTDLNDYQKTWQMKPMQRYTVQVQSKRNIPIVDAKVLLINQKGETVWKAKTDNTGKAELWANIYDTSAVKKGEFSAKVEYEKKSYSLSKLKLFQAGINSISIKTECQTPDNVDIVFIVDATGSMQDEINYLKAELEYIIKKAKDTFSTLNINLGATFYRDHGDEYLVRHSDLSKDIKVTSNFVKAQRAGGGGDFEEAVEAGLENAVNLMTWSKSAIARIAFIILDAPPHENSEVIKSLQKTIAAAAEKGIRLIPITCSGIDKSTEYLMRAMALATNGTYVFLTDDSGIGDQHIKPTTDKFTVELLSNLIARLLTQYATTTSCKQEQPEPSKTDTLTVYNPENQIIIQNDSIKSDSIKNATNILPSDSSLVPFTNWKYYPNPCTGVLNIEISGKINELYLADISGKVLSRYLIEGKQVYQIDLSEFPSGIYFLRYFYGERWLNGKVLLVR